MIATGIVSGPTRAQQGDPEQHPAQREEQVRGERPTTRVIVLSATSAFGATSAIQGPEVQRAQGVEGADTAGWGGTFPEPTAWRTPGIAAVSARPLG